MCMHSKAESHDILYSCSARASKNLVALQAMNYFSSFLSVAFNYEIEKQKRVPKSSVYVQILAQ